MSYEVTKEFKFEMAHVLSNYDGPCGNLHGHSYRCLVSFKSDDLGKAGQEAMVLDFNEAKKIVGTLIDQLDHCFAYNRNTNDWFETELISLCNRYKKKIYAFNGRTTAENMSKHIYEYANKMLGYYKLPITCSKVQLFETTTGNCVYGG